MGSFCAAKEDWLQSTSHRLPASDSKGSLPLYHLLSQYRQLHSLQLYLHRQPYAKVHHNSKLQWPRQQSLKGYWQAMLKRLPLPLSAT